MFEYYDGEMDGLENSFDGFNVNFDFDFLGIIAYVLLALGLYAIAKRRGIKNPWLAWIPIANVWLLGCISDQYQYVVNGLVKSKRKSMLTLQIISSVLVIALGIMVGVFLFALFGQMDLDQLLLNPEAYAEYMMEQFLRDESMLQQLAGWGIGVTVLSFCLVGVAITLAVQQYMAYYDLFASCDPKNKVLFLVLGIVLDMVVGGIFMAVFVFICRNKDEGMPPRKAEPTAEIPVQQPAWEPAQPQNTEWQPAPPPQEPWEQNHE